MGKKLIIILLAFHHLSLLFGQYESKLKLDTSNLNMQLKVKDDYCFACPIPFSIELMAHKSVEIFDLNTGYLSFQLNKKGKSNITPKRYSKAATGGWYRYSTYLTIDSIYETDFEQIKQNSILLNSNEKTSKEFDMINLFYKFPEPGVYVLLVEYEGYIKTSRKFSIIIDYQKCITNILNALENNKLVGGVSSLNMFYYLTGYQSWNDSVTYKYEHHYKETPELRIWWQVHKDLILKIESTLNQEQYKNLHYGDKVPDLINHLKSINYQERLAARDTLVQITGMPDWKPSSQDTDDEIKKVVDEVQQWWNKNKELITWINRVIFDSRI